jgi:3-oxoacyl-[acyl-carrier protein] reductase
MIIDDLKGARALVTGSSTGIGAAVAVALAHAGASVAVHYRSSRGEAEAVLAEIAAAGGTAVALEADLTRSAEAARLVSEAVDRLGGLDILVNNAGAMIRRAPLADLDDALFDEVLDTNVRSVLMTTRAALPALRQSSRGCVINTSSIAARNGGGPGASLYAGAKAFVLNLTRSMAKELAPDGIRVNGVSPGVIMTPFHERFSTAEWLEAQRKTIPLGRIGSPADVTGTCLYLASRTLSGYVTGQTIEVNGGQFMS